MPSGIPAIDVAQGALGGVTAALGLINEAHTKKIADELARTRPQYKISPLAGQELSLTESDLSNGMSTAAERAYTDLNNSQFSSSLDAILKSGGTPNSIGAIYGNNQEGRLRLAQMKDQLRLQQINNYVRASDKMQQEQQTQWQINDFAPWNEKAVANGQARQLAQGQVSTGLNSFGSAIGNIGQSLSENNQFAIPNGVRGGNGNGFNNTGYATGIQDTIQNTPAPNTGGILPYQQPNIPGWQGIPYQYNGG